MEEQGYALGKGVLPTSIVTRLSGVSAARLLRWRRLGLDSGERGQRSARRADRLQLG